MIAIIDTGGANLSSVSNALDRLDQQWQITKDPQLIQQADKVILPGVGAAKDSMQRIDQAGLVSVIRNLQQPVLGICLGMQLLYDKSEEGDVDCLGIIPGTVRHIPRKTGLSLPHMGWNRLSFRNPQHPMAQSIVADAWVYFVHSFYGEINEFTVATTDYGCEIPALVQKENFFGAQFHPERSAQTGTQILRNFLTL
ncbi:MAG: imidazole glycerol phosphate synthase subunit HisH [Oligoflexus sp.]